MQEVCKAHSWSLFMPEISLCGDNAAMVGAQGYYEFKAGNVAPLTLNARASMPIDEIDKIYQKGLNVNSLDIEKPTFLGYNTYWVKMVPFLID